MSTDSGGLRVQKAGLRRELRRRLAELPGSHRAAAGRQACLLLKQQKIWDEAGSILFYAPMAVELDVWPLLVEAVALGKKALLPRFDAASSTYGVCLVGDAEVDVVPGAFGIREGAKHCPALALNRLDLALVPGLAFDPHGRRLGRGKGFYDRLLSAVRGVKCGVAFDEQLLPEVPVEPHDILLNCILTPTRWIELRRAVLE